MSEENPFVAVGNDELGEPIGDTVVCPRCGERHPVEHGTDTKTGKPSNLLGFYRCGDASYLCAIDGRIVRRWVESS